MAECIALIRGINVGRANRVAMSELRKLIEDLGHTNVRTLLNSGNVVFREPRPRVSKLALSIEAGIEKRFGIATRVVVVTAADLTTIVQENPLRGVATDPRRHLVAFVGNPVNLAKARPLLEHRWEPEAFGIGSKAAYFWCARGVVDSRLPQALARTVGELVTTRNWATVLKLQAAASSDQRSFGPGGIQGIKQKPTTRV